MHGWPFLWTFIALCSSRISEAAENIVIVITPREPLIATGSTLQMNCSVQCASNCSSSELLDSDHTLEFETIDRTEIVESVDSQTKMLKYPNVSRSFSMSHIKCGVKKKGSWVPDLWAQETVRVADKPVKPTAISCIVYNWSEMVCSWEPAVQDTGLPVVQFLGYRIRYQDDKSFYKCPRLAGNTCTWGMYASSDTFRMDMEYQMYVNISNAVGSSASEIVNVNTRRIVKPVIQKTPQVLDISSTVIEVSWHPVGLSDDHKADDEYKLVHYRLKYHSEWDHEVHTISTNGTNVSISGMIPYTNYSFFLDCHPMIHVGETEVELAGFWSDPVYFYHRTLPDVPSRAPKLTSGAFRYVPDETEKSVRTVELYWQAVPARYRQGNIVQYQVTYGSLLSLTDEPIKNTSVSVSGTNHYFPLNNLQLSDLSYVVTVNAGTERGFNASLQLDRIIIASTANATRHADFFVVQHNNSRVIFFNWSSVDTASGYTVYWCNSASVNMHKPMYRNGHVRDKCEGELQWEKVGANETGFQLSYGRFQAAVHLILFGMSVERSLSDGSSLDVVLSSGIAWSDCAYDINAKVARPKDLHFSAAQWAGQLDVQWTRPDCADTNYISHYVVAFCKKDKTACQHPEDWSEVVVTNAAVTTVTLHSLAMDEWYLVKVKSSSYLGESDFTDTIQQQVLRSGLTRGAIAGIVIGTLLGCLIVVIGLITLIRMCKKWVKRYANVEIRVPEGQSALADMEYVSSANGYNMMWTEQEPMISTFVPQDDRVTVAFKKPATSDIRHHPSETVPLNDLRNTNVEFSGQSGGTSSHISPYTRTYLENDTAVPYSSHVVVGGIGLPPTATTTTFGAANGNRYPAEKSSDARGDGADGYVTSPYVQIPLPLQPAASTTVGTGPSETGISPYTVVEQATVDSRLAPNELKISPPSSNKPDICDGLASNNSTERRPVASDDSSSFAADKNSCPSTDATESQNAQSGGGSVQPPVVSFDYVSWPAVEPPSATSGNERRHDDEAVT